MGAGLRENRICSTDHQHDHLQQRGAQHRPLRCARQRQRHDRRPGGSATTISGNTTYPSVSIVAEDINASGNYAINVGTNAGAAGAVSLTGTGRGASIDGLGSPGTVTITVGSQVTIGSSTSSIGEHGIRIRSGPSDGTVTNAGTIYANYEGIDAHRQGAGTLTVTHTGAITSTSSTNSPGMLLLTQDAGPMLVTTSGDVTATTSTQRGIHMRAEGNGAITLTATGGTIMSAAQGVFIESRGTGAVTIQGTAASAAAGSGPTITSSGSHGIHVQKTSAATAGDISITTTGGSITPATTGNFYGIYVQDHAGYTGSVTIDNAADVTAARPIHVIRLGSGAVSVTNTGGTVLSMTQPGILAQNAASDASDVTVRVRGGTVRSTGPEQPAVHAHNRGTGDVIADVTAGSLISRHHAGLFAELGDAADSRIRITQGGTISARTGVLARVTRESASGEMRAASAQPMIDVAWTGTFAAGTTAQTAPNDDGRFAAASTWSRVFDLDREAAANGASGGLYGGAAGVEAYALSWSDVVTAVAQGDDPGTIDRTAQTTAVPVGATAGDNAYVAQLRAVLENGDLVIASTILTEFDSTATSVSDVDDAEIVTYLRTDAAAIRTVLRDLLREGLSDKEKAVLRAVATGDDASLTTALDDADANFSNTYKTAVRALLNRYNVGNVHVAMTGGSIDSRGDGIRAYYATPNANNGAISVTVGAGAEVTGAKDGVYVANAGEGLMLAKKYTYGFGENDGATADDLVAVTHGEGADAVALLDQLVTVAGTVTGGTGAAVHLSGGGAVIVEQGGKVHAGASGVGILVNDPGPALVHVDGEVKGGAGGAAAVHLTGGGSVIVGLNGKVEANGATRAIQGGGDHGGPDPGHRRHVPGFRRSGDRSGGRLPRGCRKRPSPRGPERRAHRLLHAAAGHRRRPAGHQRGSLAAVPRGPDPRR